MGIYVYKNTHIYLISLLLMCLLTKSGIIALKYYRNFICCT